MHNVIGFVNCSVIGFVTIKVMHNVIGFLENKIEF